MDTLFAILSADLAYAVGWGIIHSIWQIGLVAGVVALMLYTLRSASPNLRYLVACAGLVVAATVPIATAVESVRTTSVMDVRADLERSIGESRAAPVVVSVEAVVDDVIDWSVALQPALPWLFAVWLLGVLARGGSLIAAAVGVMRLRRHVVVKTGPWAETVARLAKRMKVRQAVILVESAKTEVPFVVGCFKPMIVVPSMGFAGIPPAHLEEIIAHELAHVRRHDYLVNLFQVAIETVFFYHPGVWWLSHEIRVEREHCCDDMAAEACYGPISYARALAQLEELRVACAYAMAATGGGSLLERIRRLASPTEGRRGIARVPPFVLALVVAVPLILAVTATAETSLHPADGTPMAGAPLPAAAPNADAAPMAAAAPNADAAPMAAAAPNANAAPMTAAASKVGGVADAVMASDALAQIVLPDDFEANLKAALAQATLPEDFDAKLQQALAQAAEVEAEVRRALHEKQRRQHPIVDSDDAAAYTELGYANPEVQRKFATHGIDPSDVADYRSLGFDRAETMLKLASHGVDPDDLRDFRKLGWRDLSPSSILTLARHGIDADDAKALREALKSAFKSKSAREQVKRMVRLARYGIDAADIEAYRASGYDLDARDMERLAKQGVDGQDLKEYRRGDADLRVKDIIDMRRRGIDQRDLAAYRKSKSDISVREAIDLARYGIDAEDLAQWRASDLGALSPKEIRKLRRYGVEVGDIQAFKDAGLGEPTVKALVDLARYGVEREDVQRFREAGLGQPTVEVLIKLARYGVEPSDVQGWRALGLGEVDVDVFTRLARYGIGPKDAARAREKGAKTWDEVIELRRRGRL